LKAWTKININLDILGDGPLLKKLKQTKLKNVNFYGNLDRVNVCDHINKATAIVFPSEWYESFPMTILEAFREGTIVIASNIGSIKYIIKDMYNGILFEPGNYKDLRSKIEWVIQNQEKSDKISQNALQEFKQKYSPEVNYNQLISIYKNAITKKN
jgi:glycosyltransferase involved in cell wall biosynthesis